MGNRVMSEYRMQHPRRYERNRGRDGSKAMSYYLGGVFNGVPKYEYNIK